MDGAQFFPSRADETDEIKVIRRGFKCFQVDPVINDEKRTDTRQLCSISSSRSTSGSDPVGLSLRIINFKSADRLITLSKYRLFIQFRPEPMLAAEPLGLKDRFSDNRAITLLIFLLLLFIFFFFGLIAAFLHWFISSGPFKWATNKHASKQTNKQTNKQTDRTRERKRERENDKCEFEILIKWNTSQRTPSRLQLFPSARRWD